MRKLTASETRLAQLLGVTLVLVALVFAVVYYQRSVAALDLRIADLENRKVEADFWRGEAPFWERRREWLLRNMPVLPDDGTAASRFLESVQQSASGSGLEISSQSLLEPVAGSEVEEYALRMRVGGSLEQLTRWLAELQRPEKFQAVSALNLKSDKEPPDVVCELQVTRFYLKNSQP